MEYKRARGQCWSSTSWGAHYSQTAHPSKDAVTAGRLPNGSLVTCFAAVIGADEEQATGKLHIPQAAQAADEAWQQTVQGYNGPTVTNTTVAEIEQSSSASQDEDDDDSLLLLLREAD